MTPGQTADRAWTLANQASGKLGQHVTLKKLSRRTLLELAVSFEEVARLLRSALPPPPPES